MYDVVQRLHGAATPEQLEIDSLRDQLVQIFQERMQLQRSIIDLQSQNVQNNAEISRRYVGVLWSGVACVSGGFFLLHDCAQLSCMVWIVVCLLWRLHLVSKPRCTVLSWVTSSPPNTNYK